MDDKQTQDTAVADVLDIEPESARITDAQHQEEKPMATKTRRSTKSKAGSAKQRKEKAPKPSLAGVTAVGVTVLLEGDLYRKLKARIEGGVSARQIFKDALAAYLA